MVYFISNQHTNKGLNPNIHVIDGIFNIKGRSTLHNLVANCTKKHVRFNKAQSIGNLEPSIDQMPQTPINSITTQKMIDEHIQPDAFTSPLCTLLGNVRESQNQLLVTFKSQFVQDETSIAITHLTKMQIDTGNSEPVSQRPYPITVKHYDWVKNAIKKLFDAQVICSSHSSWSAVSLWYPRATVENA